MTVSKSLLLFLCVLASSALQAGRTVQSLNDGWKFRIGSQLITDKETAATDWTLVSLPHTWNTDAYATKDYYQGKAWYKRNLYVPAEWRGRSVFLRFDGVSKWADVYVNGRSLGQHSGGYTRFTLDVTGSLRYGQNNEIAVQVDNSRQDIAPISADFTFFGGIYRNVWLITTAPVHFDITTLGADGVFISTPAVSEQSARVRVVSHVANSTSGNVSAMLRCRLIGPDGKLMQTRQKRIKLNGQAGQAVTVDFSPVSNPQLWTPEHPVLYRVETAIVSGKDSVMDSQTHYTAFRWFCFDADKGFFLNGKHYKLRGLCRHQDQYPLGTALTDDMHRHDFKLMKDMGANFIRISHYPQDEALLEQCDREGMLAWEEIPVVNYVPESEAYASNSLMNLKEMIRQHYNHPSVITWGYMNEILLGTMRSYKGEELQKAVARAHSLALLLDSTARAEDPSRPTCMAFSQSSKYWEWQLADVPQVLGWNIYAGWYGNKFSGFESWLAKSHEAVPSKPIIVTEYGAGSDLRINSHSPQRFDFSPQYQQEYIEHYVPVIENTDYVSGASYWNFVDFSSVNRAESMPRINNKGIVTTERKPKDVYYYFQSMWRKDIPVVHIASRDWPQRTGYADSLQAIKVYTNANRVELLVNGRSVGTKAVSNCNAVFSVRLAEGTNMLTARTADATDVLELFYTATPLMLTDGFKELAVNVGSNCSYTSPYSNMTWLPDRAYTPGAWGYVGGEAVNSKEEVLATREGPLYQSYRKGITEYRFDCPAGYYELTLGFTDDDAGAGRMDISVNNRQVLWAVKPEQHMLAQTKTFKIHTDGNVVVSLKGIDGTTSLSAIKLRKL